MELVGNTFFWTFFFMIGFVASLEIVEDLGPELMMRWFHRKVSAAVMIAVYVIAILLFVRMLRLLGTTYSWTANAIRNGALIYVSKRLKDKKVFRWLLVAVFITFWPFWNWDLPVTIAFIGTLLILIPLNNHQDWIKANWFRHAPVLITVSLIYWLFDMYSYHYQLGQTLMVSVAFMVVIVLAHAYDHLLVYRKRETSHLEYDNQHDALTGVRSLSKFSTDFTRYRKLAAEGSMAAVHLVMIDIDHFKRINDTYGHLAGNDVLQAFAKDLDEFIDQATFPVGLYRTGGEEFSLLIAGGATDDQARQFIDDYMAHLRKLSVKTAGVAIHLTISAGITRVVAQDTQNDHTIARADANLYAAKGGGRDRVVMN
ncbi:GGDEF domain-containing protein [Lacticaseibacillus porcinae]|uniref:GGDEF domain-containing protein n=1 Tax=Lacticaseibacillus porcinae TaxID=1123687 RepID=UPI0013DDAF8B|nr:GGDEF domain-containing protein [Lacticaseibacillus porcinae]